MRKPGFQVTVTFYSDQEVNLSIKGSIPASSLRLGYEDGVWLIKLLLDNGIPVSGYWQKADYSSIDQRIEAGYRV